MVADLNYSSILTRLQYVFVKVFGYLDLTNENSKTLNKGWCYCNSLLVAKDSVQYGIPEPIGPLTLAQWYEP